MTGKTTKEKLTTFAGVTMNETAWAKFLGISTFAFRYRKAHWAPDRVFISGPQQSGTREWYARKRAAEQRSESVS